MASKYIPQKYLSRAVLPVNQQISRLLRVSCTLWAVSILLDAGADAACVCFVVVVLSAAQRSSIHLSIAIEKDSTYLSGNADARRRGSRRVGKEVVVAVELVRRPRGLKCKRSRKDDNSESEKDYYGDELRPGTTTCKRGRDASEQRSGWLGRRRRAAGIAHPVRVDCAATTRRKVCKNPAAAARARGSWRIKPIEGCFEGCFEKLARGGTASKVGDGAGGTAKDPDAPWEWRQPVAGDRDG
ncbi:hypothetical protein K438DRAFT_2055122 [Mycena galopus ATCC 62051]|nr:hypothetical protein K438DRAFT_2055122 [Mycena galopus ATCC 62051]